MNAAELEPSSQVSDQAPHKRTGYAAINGLKMYYELSGEGPHAVYVHPILSHCGLAPQLPAQHTWISMDLQGHGRTADLERPLSCEQHSDDIAALLKQLNVGQADVFGDSFGGAIAVMLAIRHPKLVRRVAIYGSPLVPFPKDLAKSIGPDSPLIQWEREEYQKVAPSPATWPTLVSRVMEAGSNWRGLSLDELKSIQCPVLIACGDHDLIPVERCLELSRQIPNAQLAVIPDASHFVLFSNPERLLPTITRFFEAPATQLPLSTFETGYYPGQTR